MGLSAVSPTRTPAPQGQESFFAHCCSSRPWTVTGTKEILNKCCWVNLSLLVVGRTQPQAPPHNLPNFGPWVQVCSRFKRAFPHLFKPFPHSALGHEGSPTSALDSMVRYIHTTLRMSMTSVVKVNTPSNFKTTSPWCQLHRLQP